MALAGLLFMPFTFSHPALILPLLYARKYRRWVSATGLVLGSIAPDFEKFFRMELVNEFSHSVRSIFYFSCPVALGLSFVYHQVVRGPLLAHLPRVLRSRLGRYENFNWPAYFRRHYPAVLFCIILGAASHLLWDSLTHFNGRLVRAYPEMRTEVEPGEALSWYEVANWLSSVTGAIVVAVAIWRMPISEKAVSAPALGTTYWWQVAGSSAALVALRMSIGSLHFWDMGITLLASIMGGLVLASWWTGRRLKH